MNELYQCLGSGPGVFVITEFAPDAGVVEYATAALEGIIREEREREDDQSKGDHFAPGGANERIWNSYQKHAMKDPANFVEYYSNELL
jgi:hypothetical protein